MSRSTRSHANASVTYQDLDPSDPDYQEIENLITNRSIVIDHIKKINNPILDKAYQSKSDQKRAQYGMQAHERLLFHGTKKDNVDSICTNNFDWRLYGQNAGHKFGQGVSFSPNAKYASHYSDESYNKTMILAKVLVGGVCQGNPTMTLPPPGCDTSQKDDGMVLVKYEDHEFLPAFKIDYHLEENSDRDDYNGGNFSGSFESDYHDDDDNSHVNDSDSDRSVDNDGDHGMSCDYDNCAGNEDSNDVNDDDYSDDNCGAEYDGNIDYNDDCNDGTVDNDEYEFHNNDEYDMSYNDNNGYTDGDNMEDNTDNSDYYDAYGEVCGDNDYDGNNYCEGCSDGYENSTYYY